MTLRRHRVDRGGHSEKVGACIMEWVSLIWARQVRVDGERVLVDWETANGYKSDTPTCTNTYVTHLAILTNDRVSQAQRDRLARLLPRLIRASDPLPPALGWQGDDPAERVKLRLRLWMIERVLGSEGEGELTEVGRALLAGARDLVRGTTNRDAVRDLAGAVLDHYRRGRRFPSDWSDWDWVVWEHWDASNVGDLLDKLTTGVQNDELVDLLEELLDRFDKARAEEGVLGDDPQPLYLTEDELGRVVRELSGEETDE